MSSKTHVLVIPLPAQGHVGPLMKLALQIADHGIKVTFVNTDFIHAKIMAAMPQKVEQQSCVRLVSISDGLDGENDKIDGLTFLESIKRFMPGHLQDLIEKINQSNEDEQITCVIADMSVWWALEVAKKLGIKRAAIWPGGRGTLAFNLHIPKLLGAGVLDMDGFPTKDELIWLSKQIPAWSRNELPWSCVDQNMQKHLFRFVCNTTKAIKLSDWLLCNSFHELDSSACDLVPNILPIGPLLASNHLGPFAGNFWLEDSTVLSWLDKQPAGSVIYVAFGSVAKLSQQQIDELAFGLELTGWPFLWVVRSNLMNGKVAEYPDGFKKRVADHGRIVEWAPQEKVLAHPSTACFLSHCGWNSTMEGLSMGVPFLCWPYFADQYHNRSYICDTWKVGLGLTPDENGMITRHQIKTKIETLLSNDVIKANALKLKEMARKSVNEGGSSFMNFESFVEQIKQ